MQVLRHSDILDSFDIDETYDRYTNLAARIFKVTNSIILQEYLYYKLNIYEIT